MPAPTAAEVLAEIPRVLERFPRLVLCQIVRAQGSTPGKTGWKMLVRPDGSAYGNLGGGSFEALVQRDARDMLSSGAPSRVERYYLTEEAVKGQTTGMVCGGMIEVLLESLSARPVLAICGGGPVGQALARQAEPCDFELVVAEDRPEFRRAELFPDGAHRVEVERDYGEDFLAPWKHRDLYVAIVSRCWETDLAAATAVLRQAPEGLRYLGLMGSRRKIERVANELEGRSFDLDEVPWHAPIGLSLGGTTPAEIAVSIVAELVRERHRADGGARSADTGGAVRLA